jgi:hypothetical protein
MEFTVVCINILFIIAQNGTIILRLCKKSKFLIIYFQHQQCKELTVFHIITKRMRNYVT